MSKEDRKKIEIFAGGLVKKLAIKIVETPKLDLSTGIILIYWEKKILQFLFNEPHTRC